MTFALPDLVALAGPGGTDLLRDVTALGPVPSVAAVARLRERHGAGRAAAALEIVAARRRAEPKFGERATELFADLVGVEQASSLVIARNKAARFARAGAGRVVDVCCGIGGDAVGFALAGLSVVGVDRDRARAWMCRRNAGCPAVVGDAAALPVSGRWVHVDPARRDGRGRVWRLQDFQPSLSVLEALVEEAEGAAVKVGPGLDVAGWSLPGELELVSEAGRLVQAVGWTGALATVRRRATRITDEGVVTFAGDPSRAATREPSAALAGFVGVLDPAIERSGLVDLLLEELSLRTWASRELGLVTADAAHPTPWVTWYEVLAEVPWQERRLRRELAQRDAGIVDVKTRGAAISDAPALARRLRGEGGTPLVVFVLRLGTRRTALVSRRARP